MPLPDPENSRAVLIGTAAYRHLESLPAVAHNLAGLAALLRDPGGWGLPAEHCRVVLDPASADEMLEEVHRAAREATDTLLIYYAGHAFFDDDLLLTLPGSDRERLFRSVRFADLRRELTAAGRGRAVILDCAWAGPVPEAAAIADAAVVPGGWSLTAGAGNSLAPAPQHSALTGELLTVLGRGIPGGPETIDTDALYLRVRHELRAKQRPEPQQRSHGRTRLIGLARNPARGVVAEDVEPTASEVDAEPYLRMTPAVLAESVSALRAQGQAGTAAAVLAACGRARPDQEVAAIMATLAGLRRPADVAAVAFAAAGRDPYELRRIYEILVELDQRALAIGLLKVVAVGLPERTARFVAALDGSALSGAAREGAARQGATGQGSPRQGSARHGAAREGAAYQGAAREGTAYQGAAREGAAYQGAAYQGAAHQGAAHQDAAREGAAREGAAREGAAREGVTREGVTREGTGRQSATQQGAARQSATGEGATREGTPRQGTPREGTAREGTTREGAGREGAGREGSAWEGAAREGTAREGMARGGAAREGAGTAAAGDPIPALLRAAVASAKQRPHRVIDLLDALLLDRRAAAAELALGEAERVLPPADLAVVADALRDGGRDDQAYRLYGRAAEAVVRRGPERIATIVAALRGGGAGHVGRSLARQAVAVRVKARPEHLAALLDAFEAADLDDEVADAIGALAGGLARPALDEVTRLLRERERAGIALRLSLAAVADRPVDDILRLVESLNAQGRPMDALNLLAHAAQVRSIADLDRLTAPGGPAARRVFAAVAEQQPDRVAALYRALAAPTTNAAGPEDDGRREQFRAEVLRRPDTDVVAVAAELIESEAAEPAEDLLRAAGRTGRLAVAAVAGRRAGVVRHLAAVATPEELPALLRAMLDGFPAPGDAETRVAALLAGLPRRTIADTVAFVGGADEGRRQVSLIAAIAARPVAEVVTVAAAVTRPDSAATAHELLDVVARGPVRRVAELVEELRRRGERAHLRALVEAFRVRHPDSPDVFKLASWLWALDEHDVAALAVRGRLWLSEAAVGDALACAVAELLHAYAIGSARLDLAYPTLGETAAEELRRSFPIADDEACLLVLSSPKLRKPTPVLFTQRAVHHVAGDRLPYAELGEVQVSAGRRNAVQLDRAAGAAGSWAMPTAVAAREVVELLTRIQALADQLHENVRVTAQVLAGPANGYEMEGEVS